MRRFLAATLAAALCLALTACWDTEAAEQTDEQFPDGMFRFEKRISK